MKVLLFHNHYQLPGGEDAVFAAEREMLEANDVQVVTAVEKNEFSTTSTASLLRTSVESVWSRPAYKRAVELCREFRPDIAHVHNFWMKWSPSIHAACHECGVPTVQALHNFRITCCNGLLLRNDQVCEDCVGTMPWRGVVRRCYRGSVAASAGVAGMVAYNRARRTWIQDVDAFVVLSNHARGVFIKAGLPAEKLFIKPNFLTDPGPAAVSDNGPVCMFAGRLSREKGVHILLRAWAEGNLGSIGTLVIVGDGPERCNLEVQARTLGLSRPRVLFTGHKRPEEMKDLFRRARLVVVPSTWYEGFPMTIVEAFANGTPVVASRLGAMVEMIEDGETGLLVDPAEPVLLAHAVKTLLGDPSRAARMGQAARRSFVQKYTPRTNFAQLMSIYRSVIERRGNARATDRDFQSVGSAH